MRCACLNTCKHSAGKPFWEAAGVRGKIDLRIGPAAETLDELLKARNAGNAAL
jgi:hypothetical protein